MFELSDGYGERMWVDVAAVKGDRLVGTLRNTPSFIPRLAQGDRVKLRREHVIDIIDDEPRTH